MNTFSSIQKNINLTENKKLLKLRDVYYQKARNLNTLIFILSIIPITYSICSKLFNPSIFHFELILGKDYTSTLISLISSIIIFILATLISNYKTESNILRQAYDCKVFNIRGNKFLLNLNLKTEIANLTLNEYDEKHYANWYGEDFFIEDSIGYIKNILICQVDNLLYTTYLYKSLNKILNFLLTILCLFFIYILIHTSISGSIIKVTFEYLIPLTPIFTLIILVATKCKSFTTEYSTVFEVIIKDFKQGLINTDYLEMIQDKILINRMSDVIVPSLLRNYFLKDGNEYKKKLSEFRFWLKSN